MPIPKEKRNFIEKSKSALTAVLLAALMREAFVPKVVRAEQTPVSSPSPNFTAETQTQKMPDMYRGVDIRDVPELQIFFIGELSANFNEKAINCTCSALTDPESDTDTRFILIAKHCAKDGKDAKFNPSGMTVTFSEDPDTVYTVVWSEPIAGSADSSLAMVDKPIPRSKVTSLTVAQEPMTEVAAAGYGRNEVGPAESPRLGYFLAGDFQSDQYLIFAQEGASQPWKGDSGMSIFGRAPQVTKNAEGKDVYSYETSGTLWGSKEQINPNETTTPSRVSAITSQTSRDFIDQKMAELRDQEYSPVPRTITHILIDGGNVYWQAAGKDKIISTHTKALTQSVEIYHQGDDNQETSTTVSNVTVRKSNDSPNADTTFNSVGDSIKLKNGTNPVGTVNISLDTNNMTPFSNDRESYTILGDITKTLADGRTIVDTFAYYQNYIISNPAQVDLLSLKKQPVFYSGQDGELKASIENQQLIVTYTGTSQPRLLYLELKLGDLSIPVYAQINWEEADISSNSKEIVFELADQLRVKEEMFLPRVGK